MSFLCQRYAVSRSGFYAWLARKESSRAKRDRALAIAIARIYAASEGRYGSPRVHRQLRRENIVCSVKRVARLMREAGLRGRAGHVYRRQPGLHRFFLKTDNRRLGQPQPNAPNQVWVGDLTYLRLGERWRYLAAVMDLYSRRIVGWAVARTKSVTLTLCALKRAIKARAPRPGLLFHSDRGIEYASYRYQRVLQLHGILPSMNRPRSCQDNAHMESFFHSLKTELLHKRTLRSEGALNALLAGYINRFYNTKRLHSALSYHAPVEFESLAFSQ